MKSNILMFSAEIVMDASFDMISSKGIYTPLFVVAKHEAPHIASIIKVRNPLSKAVILITRSN